MMSAVCTLTTETLHSLDLYFYCSFFYMMIYSVILKLGVRTLKMESKINLCRVRKDSRDVNKRFLAFI